jgi:2-polyprenyl-6-hydroxyphenyl methylase/3-demethylubiquinone-9 3-methyltransferase
MTDRNTGLERKIANCFRAIADNGWFPDDVDGESPQLALVRDVLQPRAGMRILDAGCARGRFLRQLNASGARLFGVDLTEVFLHSAHANVPDAGVAGGSIGALPFAEGSFDSVYCIETLEHLPDTEAALAEMARVLRPGGTLLVIDKNMTGLHPRNGAPNILWKPWMERRGRWMYPAGMGFREKWFWPGGLAKLMGLHFDAVTVRFQTEGFGTASRLYRLLPFLSFEAAWSGRKRTTSEHKL